MQIVIVHKFSNNLSGSVSVKTLSNPIMVGPSYRIGVVIIVA